MEVHTHSHATGKKWTGYLWEFLMLFLAVFCGFLAENQREHLVEHNRAKDYARGLIRDLNKDTANIVQWEGYIQLYISLMDSLIKMGMTKHRITHESGKFAWYCRHALWHVPIPWQRTTLEQIKNSGNIRYFKSYKLQEMISTYNMETEGEINFFELENPSSDETRDLANKILDNETNYKYSQIGLGSIRTFRQSYIDSLTARVVSFTNKDDLINEMVNMAIYRRRNYLPVLDQLPAIKKQATQLINELKKEYHLL